MEESELASPVDGRPRKVIIAGFGPVGRAIAGKLDAAGMDIVVIELNEQTIHRQRKLARTMVHGDVTDQRTLEEAGIHEADALILTIPDGEAVIQACELARRLAPNIYIAARTKHLSQGLLATQAGADEVIVEEVVTAEAMQSAVQRHLVGDRQPAS